MSVLQDLDANLFGHRRSPGRVVATVLTARFTSVVLHRVAAALGGVVGPAGGVVKQLNQFLTGADVAWSARIGPGLILFHPQGVVLGENVTIGARCQVQQGVTIGGMGAAVDDPGPMPVLGDDVKVGTGAKILGGITIGDGARIGANAVVLQDVPAGASAVGVPARIVGAPARD